MALKIYKPGEKKLFPLTSPPKKPEPKPDDQLIAKIMSYPDRDVYVSVPFPDKISLISDVMEQHMLHPPMGTSFAAKYNEIDQDIFTWVKSFKEEGGKIQAPEYVPGGIKPKVHFKIREEADGDILAHMFLERRMANKQPGVSGFWSVRVEFNPAKLGHNGLVKLISLLHEYLAEVIKSDALLTTFSVSRIDVAIDCIGVWPVDLVAQIKQQGKKRIYIGNGGRIESQYFHARTKPKKGGGKPKKTFGPLRLTIYDKRVERIQAGFQPPYGDTPVTRVEISKRWNTGKSRPLLSELESISDLFKANGAKIAYAAPVGNYRADWRLYCLAALSVGALGAGTYPKDTAKLKRYQTFKSDIVTSESWTRWSDGLALTGLDHWVALAAGK